MSSEITNMRVLHGQNISYEITAHQLAAMLLAAPDVPVYIPQDDAITGDVELNGVSIGRMTHDGERVWLSAFCLGPSWALIEHFDIAADYDYKS